MDFAGIDYGSKKAGTTVIAFPEGSRLRFAQSEKNRDADLFIEQWCAAHHPDQVFLDAPLSLPGVFRQLPGYDDYFYRKADREVHAMSPMFLGGLTARAMQLRALLEKAEISVYEVYPGKLSKVLGLDSQQYKKSKHFLPSVLQQIVAAIPWQVEMQTVKSWHHIDALLAFFSGWRYREGKHDAFGDQREGQIIV